MMKRMLAGITAAVMVFSLLYVGTAKADADKSNVKRETIAALDYVYADAEDVEPGEECDLNSQKYGDKEGGYKFTTGKAELFASVTGTQMKTLEWAQDDVMNEETGVEEKQIIPVYDMDGTKEYTPVMSSSKTKNPWPTDTEAMPYFEMRFSTKGMEEVEVSAYVGATKKGPRDYRITYAVGNNTNFAALSDETAKLSLEKNKKLQQIRGTLPEDAADQELVKVRIEIASLLQVDQSKATEEIPEIVLVPGSGEAAVNHICITGTPKAGANVVSTPTPQTAETTPGPTIKPTASPAPDVDKKTPAVKKLKLNKKKLTLKKGKKYTLKLSIISTAKTAKEKKTLKKAVQWSSSKKKVATVSKTGKVKAKKKGKTTITAKLKGKKVRCKVTVKK